MRISTYNQRGCAFTFVEVLIVAVGLFTIAALVLPTLQRPHTNSRTYCRHNFRQLHIALDLWTNDHDRKYPMQIPIADGGSQEYNEGRKVFRHFQVLWPYCKNLRLFVCPADKDRTIATNIAALDNSHVSYFVGIDIKGTDSSSNLVLVGDRNITNGTEYPRHSIYTLTTNRPVGWTSQIHSNRGTVLLGDGTVTFLSSDQLRDCIAASGLRTNRIAVP